jgi:hypothetical protein
MHRCKTFKVKNCKEKITLRELYLVEVFLNKGLHDILLMSLEFFDRFYWNLKYGGVLLCVYLINFN